MTLQVRALAFDVFGTVVDWYSSVRDEVLALGLPVDAGAFALAWRAGYQPAMQSVREGRLPWTDIDGLHRRVLDGLLQDHGLSLTEAQADHLNRAWHRLRPWPDAVGGLARLKRHCPVVTLSNGNVSLLLDMARHAGLPWDTIFSAELFGHYKPDPQVYQGAARLLGLAPHELWLVAAHPSDLRGAARAGLRTVLVPRTHEYGPTLPPGAPGGPEPWQDGDFDLVVPDFHALADRLGV